MAREGFQRDLERLQREVVDLADAVAARLRRAVTAFATADRRLAHTVVDGDDTIDERYLRLESDCIDLFALQQPVASDLRVVAATYKILTDLERVADLANNVAKYAAEGPDVDGPDVDFRRLGETAIEMFDDAVDAYVHADVETCNAVADRDDAFDAACESALQAVIRWLVDSDPDGTDFETRLQQVSRLLLTIRDLERVGDHAVNVAARTRYVVESDDALLY